MRTCSAASIFVFASSKLLPRTLRNLRSSHHLPAKNYNLSGILFLRDQSLPFLYSH